MDIKITSDKDKSGQQSVCTSTNCKCIDFCKKGLIKIKKND